MLELTVPTIEETQVKINAGEKSITMDIFEFAQLQKDVINDLKKRGIEVTTTYLAEGLQAVLQEEYGLSVGISGCINIQAAVITIQEGLKKKYSPSSDSQNSTDSPQESNGKKKKNKDKNS